METHPRLYAKGVRKRQEILDRSLDVIAQRGFGETILRDIADAVNLSQAGVLHYFPSSEDLYLQIVDARERRRMETTLRQVGDSGVIRIVDGAPAIGPEDPDSAIYTLISIFLRNIHHAQQTPGLIELFVRMQALASSPSNPAYEYFRRRTDIIHASFEPFVAEVNRRGLLMRDWDPGKAISIIVAMADGLELQWVRDHGIDITGTLTLFFDLTLSGFEEWRRGDGIVMPIPDDGTASGNDSAATTAKE